MSNRCPIDPCLIYARDACSLVVDDALLQLFLALLAQHQAEVDALHTEVPRWGCKHEPGRSTDSVCERAELAGMRRSKTELTTPLRCRQCAAKSRAMYTCTSSTTAMRHCTSAASAAAGLTFSEAPREPAPFSFGAAEPSKASNCVHASRRMQESQHVHMGRGRGVSKHRLAQLSSAPVAEPVGATAGSHSESHPLHATSLSRATHKQKQNSIVRTQDKPSCMATGATQKTLCSRNTIISRFYHSFT